jgi:hypothetical protein
MLFRPFLAEELEEEIGNIIASLVEETVKLLGIKSVGHFHDVFDVIVRNLDSGIVSVVTEFEGFAAPTQNVFGRFGKRCRINGNASFP